jgi:MoaA/NifB/PqqE/SkfB family radical SAM enzyme
MIDLKSTNAKQSKTMCIMPWVSISTSPIGGIYPCCWSIGSDARYSGPVSKYRNSDHLKKIKDTMLRGEWPEICKVCEECEHNGTTSKRQRENAIYHNEFGSSGELPDHFQIFDLRLSNLCNLGCITCGPFSSHFLLKEAQRQPHVDLPIHIQSQFKQSSDYNLFSPYTAQDIEEIITLIQPGARIYLTGGEPSLISKVWTLLEKLKKRRLNESVYLQINSNFFEHNPRWLDLLRSFKGEIWPSLDGVGPLAEYVRYPCKWDQVSSNIKDFIAYCPHWDVKIMPTLSILSVSGLKTLFKYVYIELATIDPHRSGKISISLSNILKTPAVFNLRNLPKRLKQQAIIDLEFVKNIFPLPDNMIMEKQFLEDLLVHIKLPPTLDFHRTLDELNKFDRVRNNDWRKIYPQFVEFSKLSEPEFARPIKLIK